MPYKYVSRAKLLYTVALLLGVGMQSPAVCATKPKILSTTTFLHDLVQKIGGSEVEALSLVGPGVDPHLYKATARDLRKMREASLIVAHGLGLEGRLFDVLKQFQSQSANVLFAAEDLPKKRLFENDPHVWFDPELWILVSQKIEKGLIQTIPNNAATFQTRQDQWEAQVLAATGELQKKIDSIPAKRKILITSHDAFRYWGRFFGVEVEAIQGVSTDSEPSLKHINKLVTLVKDRGVPALFVETSVSSASIERLMSLTNTKIGGELFSDSLGGAGSGGETYLKALAKNVDVFVTAMQSETESNMKEAETPAIKGQK